MVRFARWSFAGLACGLVVASLAYGQDYSAARTNNRPAGGRAPANGDASEPAPFQAPPGYRAIPVTPVGKMKFDLNQAAPPPPVFVEQVGDLPMQFQPANGKPVNAVRPVAHWQDDAARGDQRLPATDARAAVANAPGVAPSYDANLVSAGQGAFQRGCVSCHDSAKSLEKQKSLGQWRGTVRRMAAKDGADIASEDIEPIATYLAATAGGGVAAGGDDGGGGGPTVFGTISPTWRGGNDNIQNSGFFPDAWVGVSFNNGSAVSGKATACISCHTEPGEGSRIELVEASVRLDLAQALCLRNPSLRSSLEFGRIVVPFGAFAQQSNPGVYRTVSKPLMYNMGFRVFDEDLGDPVLPMPYSDEGLVLSLGGDLTDVVKVDWDVYTVNGLQAGADGIDFDLSRDYVAINSSPSVGTRLTLGSQSLKFGSSLISGQSSPTGGVDPNGTNLYYRIYGFDATYRLDDIFRLQFEYARRDSDRMVGPVHDELTRDHVAGYYVEGELLLLRARKVSLLVRYDQQDRHSVEPPPESSLPGGNFRVSRFTYGLNFVLPGGSLFMVNHERWMLPGDLGNMDVVGARWAVTF